MLFLTLFLRSPYAIQAPFTALYDTLEGISRTVLRLVRARIMIIIIVLEL